MIRAPGCLCALSALCVYVLCAATCAGADEQTLVFDPPPTVSIRQTNGATARGRLLSVTEQELLLRAVNGKEVTFKLERIRFVKTNNDTFEYWPNDESFADLCDRADKVPNATLSNPAVPAARGARPGRAKGKQDPADQRGDGKSLERAAAAPSGNDILAPGRTGVAPGTMRQRVQVDDAEKRRPARRNPAAESEPATTDTPSDIPAPGSTVYICSNCMRDLPATVRSGDTCPHCGELIVFDEDSAESAATDLPKADPFVAAGPATVPAAVAPVAAPPPTSGGLSLSEVPLIAKIGIFIGLLVLGWIILQRR